MTDEEPDYRALDVSEYNQQKRLEDIINARRQALKDYREFSTEAISEHSRVNLQTARHAVFASTKAYLTEVEQLIRQHGDNVYYQRPVDKITIEPPKEYQYTSKGNTETVSLPSRHEKRKDVQLISDYPEPKEIVIVGLLSERSSDQTSYIDINGPFTQSWEIGMKIRHQGQRIVTGSNTSHVPIPTSYRAIQMINKFVNEAGLDVDFEPDKGPAQIENL